MTICPSCRHECREAARFCDSCGALLDARTEVRLFEEDPQLAAVRAAFAGKYRVISLLGRGGMGSVYRAHDPSLDREIAIKLVPADGSVSTTTIERFRREARLAAKLRHPRIVSIHEVGLQEGFHYFSMDYIEGETLRALVRRKGALDAEDALHIVTEITRAVAHAHGKKVIHRDLKPENVMVDREGEVFVMDFGLARSIDDTGLTQSGAVLGTPLYMSPEQLAGESVDERTDVFAIGLMLYWTLTGIDLFAADSITGIVSKQISTPVARVVQDDSRIPATLHAPLLAMLERDPSRRSASAKEVLERLTLRRIVSMGIEATGHPDVAGGGTVPMISIAAETIRLAEVPEAGKGDQTASDVRDEVGAKRRARLKALLDEL